MLIQVPVILAEAKSSILFSDKEEGAGHRTLEESNVLFPQVFLEKLI